MKRITALSLLITVPLTLVATACSKTVETKDGDSSTENQGAQEPAVKAERQTGPVDGEFAVQCGCQIDGIDACGNYVHVGEHAFEIEGDLGLGIMEWCGVDGTKQATIKGKLEGDKFYAESLAVKP